MVGEIRDELTAKMAVRAAITGHKVYSTIHTKDPKAVYYRLEEMGVKGYLIRDAICGIISQRLIKTICFNCREEIFINGIRVYKKKGCNKCNGTGYIGRKVVASVIYIKKSMGNNNQYDEILSNNEMIFGLKELLLRGEIDYYDYLCFIEEEELNEN